MLEKPKLFLTLKEFWLTMLFLLFLLALRLFVLYGEYEEFKNKPFFYTEVKVIQAYEKWNDDEYHTILRLYSPILDINFFSRTKVRAKEIPSGIRLKIYPQQEMRFSEYLGTSFIYSQINELLEPSKNIKNELLFMIEKQHQNMMISNFYNAIFFATPLEKKLRTQVASLGISHLIALSGFHLAILSTLLFFLIRMVYQPIQQRYFPYRFDLFDVGFMVLLILAWYVWFVDAPPSLVRSYMMMFVGWVLLVFGMELISFAFLLTIVLLLLVIFPKMLLSLAFWFSVMGVFYIFLLLKYFSHLNKSLITVLISFGIFLLMLPIVHMIFPIVSPLQLLSPFLSLLFGVFYPISMGLHLLGIGDLLDGLLLTLFTLKSSESYVLINTWYGVAYLLFSLMAIYSKRLFYVLFSIAFVFFVALFMGFWV